jgi:hypothetical protein
LTVLTKKYYEALRRGPTDELSEIIIAEECQNYVRGRRPDEPPSIGERIINELRSFGVGVVLIAPDPIQIPWHIARDVGALIAIGNQALPDFLEQMRYRYGRTGLEVIGKTNSTFVYHRSKLTAVRFKPRPQRPITLKASSPKTVEEGPKVTEGQTIEPKVIEVEELTAKPKVVEVEGLESATEPKIVEEQAPKGPPTPPPGS